MRAPLPAPLPPPAMPPPSAPTAAPPSAPIPASFAAFKILSFVVFSGPPWAAATRLHSATTVCGGTPLRETGADVEGAGAGVVGAWATCGFTVVDGDADGAATLVSLVPVRFATTIPVTTATTAAITSPIAVIFHIWRLSSAMARFLLSRMKQTTCQRLRAYAPPARRDGSPPARDGSAGPRATPLRTASPLNRPTP